MASPAMNNDARSVHDTDASRATADHTRHRSPAADRIRQKAHLTVSNFCIGLLTPTEPLGSGAPSEFVRSTVPQVRPSRLAQILRLPITPSSQCSQCKIHLPKIQGAGLEVVASSDPRRFLAVWPTLRTDRRPVSPLVLRDRAMALLKISRRREELPGIPLSGRQPCRHPTCRDPSRSGSTFPHPFDSAHPQSHSTPPTVPLLLVDPFHRFFLGHCRTPSDRKASRSGAGIKRAPATRSREAIQLPGVFPSDQRGADERIKDSGAARVMVDKTRSRGGWCARTDDDTDRMLAQRSTAGDREAFAALLERHYDRIYRLAARLLADADDAVDLAQNVCVALPAKLASYRGGSRFTAWRYSVVVNAARRAAPQSRPATRRTRLCRVRRPCGRTGRRSGVRGVLASGGAGPAFG